MIGGPKGAAAKLGLKPITLIHRMQKLGIYRSNLPPTTTEGPLICEETLHCCVMANNLLGLSMTRSSGMKGCRHV